jgi:membrane-bound metal-dependent hydrolase YbcI (DUF457 family)
MPGYKTHMAGAAALTGAAVAGTSWLGLYRPDLETMLGLGVLSVLGGLFPDVDTDSKGRRLFYGLAVIADAVLILRLYYRQAALLGFFALLPAIDGHRGWTHSWWAALVVPSPILLAPVYLLHQPWPAMIPYYLAGVLGYFSHLLLDAAF